MATASRPSQAEKLLEELEFLFRGYSEEPRAITQPHYLARLVARYPDYVYNPEDALIRESLMEYIGSSPIVAIAFYPYIDDAEVDLGRALTMLAIHDIGELEIGDEMTFTKNGDSKEGERQAALRLLHPFYYQLYDEIDAVVGKTAQFAKAIDKITSDIWDYFTPAAITMPRYKHFVGVEAGEIVELIQRHKRPYMLWNPFMTEFHTLLLGRLLAKLQQARD
jgi:hypothetical protein